MKVSRTGTALAAGLGLGLAGACLPLAPPTAQAAVGAPLYTMPGDWVDLSLGLESMGGDTTTSIGGTIVTTDGQTTTTALPLSEIRWPLDMALLRLDAGWTFWPGLRVNGVFKTNLTDPDEYIIDQDWLTDGEPRQLDVYSESKVESLDALILDVDVEWIFLQDALWNVYTGLGYQYQDFSYEGAPIYQYSPSGMTGYDFTGSGELGVTYDQSYAMVYLLIGGDMELGHKLRVSGRVALAPFVMGEDEIVLLLRDKTANGDTDGMAWMLDLSATYTLAPMWHLKAGLHATGIDTDGDQEQVLNGQRLGRIDQESESQQTSVYLNLGYSF